MVRKFDISLDRSRKFDIYGIGNPLMDLLVRVSTNKLQQLGIHKGTMTLIDLERREYLLNTLSDFTILPGGSCANTILALADLGSTAIYGGAIGDDDLGKQFVTNLEKLNTIPALKTKTLPTGSSIILITEDADRSQNTYLGACQQYEKIDVDVDRIKNSKILYFTGYMWDTENQKEALKFAIDIAKENNTKIIFDVADPFAVGRSKTDFIEIIKNDVDFVFSNLDEAKALTESDNIDDVLFKMKELNPHGVIKIGSKGSVIYNDDEIINIDSFKVKTIDTTGAGDIYAAGFIYGILQEYELKKSGEFASLVASKIVEQIGARLDYSLKQLIS